METPMLYNLSKSLHNLKDSMDIPIEFIRDSETTKKIVTIEDISRVINELLSDVMPYTGGVINSISKIHPAFAKAKHFSDASQEDFV